MQLTGNNADYQSIRYLYEMKAKPEVYGVALPRQDPTHLSNSTGQSSCYLLTYARCKGGRGRGQFPNDSLQACTTKPDCTLHDYNGWSQHFRCHIVR